MGSPEVPRRSQEKTKSRRGWIVKISLLTFVLAAFLNYGAELLSFFMGFYIAIAVLLFFVFCGIFFDILGVAVTAAEDTPYIAMSSRKIKGSRQAIWLVRRAEIVANICNDVIGDICGILSGSTGAAIVLGLTALLPGSEKWIAPVIGAGIATLTVGGKALGKSFAMKNAQQIILILGKVLALLGWKG